MIKENDDKISMVKKLNEDWEKKYKKLKNANKADIKS